MQGFEIAGYAIGEVAQTHDGSLGMAHAFIDAIVISTDSPEYARKGGRYGLDAPFLRPPELSTDTAGIIETMEHTILQSEKHYPMRFDVILIIEPTSPLRTPEDAPPVA